MLKYCRLRSVSVSPSKSMNEVGLLNWKAEMEIRFRVGDKETKELVTTLGKERGSESFLLVLLLLLAQV